MKKRNLSIKFLGLLLLSTFALLVTACMPKEKTIKFGEGDWDSNAIHDQIAKYIIEKGYDTKVEIVLADTSLMVSALKAGNIDVTLEMWTDNIVTYDQDIKDGYYEELSVNFADNKQGLYIPKYLQEQYPDLVTVEDLKDYVHLFPDPDSNQGIIYGGPEGWSATEFLHKKMALYGLDDYYNFKPIDSNAILSATLKSAYDKQEPWVGYNWEPTWVMGIYDLVLLEDTDYSAEKFLVGDGAFPSTDVTVVVRDGFKDEHEAVYTFLSNYETSTEITNLGLAYMQENEVEADQAALWFLKTYESMWTTWVTEEAKTKILNSLK
ncbi:MAG: glycine betaine ABC transporter substrate-binding protein [Acholeplasma sp.]|nr:glycine betaine ABC transporter substrate-binding protein [Acholeplasma sp.]